MQNPERNYKLYVGDIIFVPNSYRNFHNGKPIYWVLLQHHPDESGLFLCMMVTKLTDVSDGMVYHAYAQESLGDVAVHTSDARWLHEDHELAEVNVCDKMDREDIVAIRKMLVGIVKGDKTKKPPKIIPESGNYDKLWAGLHVHASVLVGEVGIDEFEEVN